MAAEDLEYGRSRPNYNDGYYVAEKLFVGQGFQDRMIVSLLASGEYYDEQTELRTEVRGW